MINGVTKENLMRTLPAPLRADPNAHALASAVADELASLFRQPSHAIIYGRIDELDEAAVDALAVDYKIGWWRPDASLEEKRAAIKASWYIHKHLGTKSAIETAVADYFGGGKVEEWFEYGGQPYHFRIATENNDAIITQYAAFMAVLNAVKRCSAVLEHLSVLLSHSQPFYVGIAMKMAKTGTVLCEPADISTALTDENGAVLLDESGNVLTA